MICPKCGRKFDDGTVFCTHCGEKCVDDSIIQLNAQETQKTENGGA
jgi:uncharacterized membrane protein YvbJ